MGTITINKKRVQFENGETILAATRRAGVSVPTLCNMDELAPSGACRICSVEVEGFGTLLPACSYPACDGMIIETHSQKAVQARKTIVELLLASHPDDCLYCVRNGNCELAKIAQELGVRKRRYSGNRERKEIDISSPSLERDPEKCILCGKCVRTCEEIQKVACIDFAHRGSQSSISCAFGKGINVTGCIGCGQCIMRCPTAALREKSFLKEVIDAIKDPDKIVVVQHAPSISVTLAEEFGMKAGSDVCGTMTAALRRLGFDFVFDTSFAADLTIMEEASEFAHRFQHGGRLPMFTSCSPGWVRYIEQYEHELIPNLSSCKSPQQMLGALIKSYWADKAKIDRKKIVSVSIMPCTAKKFEAGRIEMQNDALPDVDYVLTTRELARFIKIFGINLLSLQPEASDTPFGTRSTSGKIFGATGGVMEAALRTSHFLLTGKEDGFQKIPSLRGLDGIKEATIKIEGIEIGVAVVSGIANAKRLIEQVKSGRRDLHFVEVMTCPGGCIAGGGQPLGSDTAAVRSRMQSLYRIDQTETMKCSYKNEAISQLYKEFLEAPLSEVSHKLLHTHYSAKAIDI